MDPSLLTDPFKFARLGWPDRVFTDYQAEIVEAVASGTKSVLVPAANMLGKDYIAAFIAIWYFSSRTPARVLTTSADHSQLQGVLWGEMRSWINTCKVDLGIKVNDLQLRQIRGDGTLHPLSEAIGRVAQTGVAEGLLGRHVPRGPGGAPRALGIIDEASSCDDVHRDAIETWAHQTLSIGNCYDTTSYFDRETEAGDLEIDGELVRKVIRIRAEQSPNVRLGLAEERAGKRPSHREVVPGCMSYREYKHRRVQWTPKQQSIGLDAQFYRGQEVRMYPEDWLELSAQRHLQLIEDVRSGKIPPRVRGIAMGVDPGAGGDSTVWTVVDQWGVLEQMSKKTADTTEVAEVSIRLGEKWDVAPVNWRFDAGGGGKQHADYLAKQGYPVQSIAFGASATAATTVVDPKTRKKVTNDPRKEYRNRRSQMSGELRAAVNPSTPGLGGQAAGAADFQNVFAIPQGLTELHRQMRPIPLQYDAEGRMSLIPKSKKNPKDRGTTLIGLLGGSPDEFDSTILAIHGATHQETVRVPRFL